MPVFLDVVLEESSRLAQHTLYFWKQNLLMALQGSQTDSVPPNGIYFTKRSLKKIELVANLAGKKESQRRLGTGWEVPLLSLARWKSDAVDTHSSASTVRNPWCSRRLQSSRCDRCHSYFEYYFCTFSYTISRVYYWRSICITIFSWQKRVISINSVLFFGEISAIPPSDSPKFWVRWKIWLS